MFEELHNFTGLVAFYSALNKACVHRLTWCWDVSHSIVVLCMMPIEGRSMQRYWIRKERNTLGACGIVNKAWCWDENEIV